MAGKARGHGRPYQTADGDTNGDGQSPGLSSLWSWMAKGFILLLLVLTVWGLAYVPTPEGRSLTYDLGSMNVSELSGSGVQRITPIGGNNKLIFILSQPQQSHYAPDADRAIPQGWWGEARCELSARDFFDKPMYEFGVVADFLYTPSGMLVWPQKPVSSGNAGWSIASPQSQQSSPDPSTGVWIVSATGSASFINLANSSSSSQQSSLTFTVVLLIYPSGQFVCGLITSSTSTSDQHMLNDPQFLEHALAPPGGPTP